ncbi:MAG: hypothetical protein RLY57_480 [Candidatus Parcubacteria bacterium]
MHIFKDICIVVISILVAILMVHVGFVDSILTVFESPLVASFVAGIFFTSLLTISPASIVLAELGTRGAPLEIAFFGALGALIGDMLLFYFVKDRISADIAALLKNKIEHYHLDQMHSRYARWVLPMIGAFIIASPLPDELGIMLMGAAKMKTRYLIPVSFVMNFIGVLLVLAVGEIAIRH